MLLRKIKLVNFRQFYGENEIIFAVGEQQNVTLIHGENGVGKTTLLNGILWCLFGDLTEDFENKSDLVSEESVKSGGKTCRVDIVFEYEEHNYNVIRKYDSHLKKSTFSVFKVDGGNYEEVRHGKSLINSILPQDMAGYFFFHGEGISDISNKKSGEKFRRAIRDILGFTFAEAAIEDLNKIKKEQTVRLLELQSIKKEVRAAATEKARQEKQQKDLESQIKQLIKDIDDSNEEYEKYNELIKQSGHAVAKQLKLDETKRRAEIKNLKQQRKAINLDKQSLIHKYGWTIFGYDLAEMGLNFIDEESLKGRIPAPYDKTLVDDLIEAKVCICGRDLTEGTGAYRNVLKMVETANTALITQRLSKARSIGDKIKGLAHEFLQEVEKIEERSLKLENIIGDQEEELKDIQKKLDDVDQDNIKGWETKARAATQRGASLNRERGEVKNKLERCNSSISKLESTVKTGGTTDPQVTRITAYQDMIGDLVRRCLSKLEEFESETKGEIASQVNEIFTTFSRKDYKVMLSSDFEFHLVTEQKKKVAKGRGENLLLNLAFVSALIKYAEKRSGADGRFLLKGTVAPFVIDAPFGELDNKYKEATASFLPKNSKQLVLLLSSSHWKGEVEDSIRKSIGREYILINNRRVKQGNKPVDEISILGTKYIQSKYSQSTDSTSIEDITHA